MSNFCKVFFLLEEGEQVTVVKSFNIPVDFPFDVSDNTFEIRYNNNMFSDSVAYDAYPGHGGHGPSAGNIYSSSSTTHSNSTPGISRTSELFNTYYIYTFDGKLLAEYDHNGSCVRDYIYAGNRLIAEYKPQTSEYFYYMTDQISSTRIIANSSGNVVFSEAYGPYGDVQKTWTNTYDPKMKFSGKEREGYSDLDYFGARYFDHKSYRFNSVDPVINREEALSSPQLWNLYAYCRNNPISFFDPIGLDNYVFYDPKNFSTQAKVESDRLRELNNEPTHSYSIKTEEEFVKKWNSMKNPTNVTLLFHSGGGEAYGSVISIDAYNHQYLTTNPKGKTPSGSSATYIGNLHKHSIGTLRLFICGSAGIDLLDINSNALGQTFYRTQNVKTVKAASGPVNYDPDTWRTRFYIQWLTIIRR